MEGINLLIGREKKKKQGVGNLQAMIFLYFFLHIPIFHSSSLYTPRLIKKKKKKGVLGLGEEGIQWGGEDGTGDG